MRDERIKGNSETRVLSLYRALNEFDKARLQAVGFLLSLLPSIEGDGFFATSIPGPTIEWDAYYAIGMGLLSHGVDIFIDNQPHQDWAARQIYVQNVRGAAFVPARFPGIQPIYNNFEAACFGQSKTRASGVWMTKDGFKNRLLLRIPHR